MSTRGPQPTIEEYGPQIAVDSAPLAQAIGFVTEFNENVLLFEAIAELLIYGILELDVASQRLTILEGRVGSQLQWLVRLSNSLNETRLNLNGLRETVARLEAMIAKLSVVPVDQQPKYQGDVIVNGKF
jgi:uncharacterized coiled-coil protein SlyX